MTDHLFPAKQRLIVDRWCLLAERRLEYLTELYDSGRWQRFHTEAQLLENVREARDAIQTWRGLQEQLGGGARISTAEQASTEIRAMAGDAGGELERASDTVIAALQKSVSAATARETERQEIQRTQPAHHRYPSLQVVSV